MTESPTHRPWLFRFAVLTLCVALGTVLFGALTTTKNAGMAFRDWPTSDGHNMVTYPWFSSSGDKFLEHGHRLAGLAIGACSLVLCGLTLCYERRRSMRWLAVGIVAGVILQGLLGGFRVQLDERGLATVHGAFAAWVLSLIALLAQMAARGWQTIRERRITGDLSVAKSVGVLTLVVLFGQYLLGGAVRHHHTGLHEHLALGLLALALVIINAVVAARSGIGWIRRAGWMLLGVVLLQVGLGLTTWALRFGLPSFGFVATTESIGQVVTRTAHMMTGILVFATAVLYCVRVFRCGAVCVDAAPAGPVPSALEHPAASTARGTI